MDGGWSGRLLAEAEAAQKTGNMIRMILNAEGLFDEIGDAGIGPKLAVEFGVGMGLEIGLDAGFGAGQEPGGAGAANEGGLDLEAGRGVEARRTPWGGPSLDCLKALVADGSPPAVDAAAVDGEAARDLGRGAALAEHIEGAKATAFEFFGGAEGAHGVYIKGVYENAPIM
jgi:hypothetical protein